MRESRKMRQDVTEKHNFPKTITRQQALEIISKQLPTVAQTSVPVADSCGHVAAETILSTISMPEHDRSAMDGFALASSATDKATAQQPVSFRVSGEIRPSPSKETGQKENALFSANNNFATKILTGGIIPNGSDAVIPFEHVTISEDNILVSAPVKTGDFIRKAGADILHGEVLVAENNIISACSAALLAYSKKYHFSTLLYNT